MIEETTNANVAGVEDEAAEATKSAEAINDNFIEVKKPGFTLTFNMIVIILSVSVAYILAVCLISGLVFRNINACTPESSAQNQNTTPLPTTPTTTPTTPSTTPTTSPTTPSTTPTTPPTTPTTPPTTPTTPPTTPTTPPTTPTTPTTSPTTPPTTPSTTPTTSPTTLPTTPTTAPTTSTTSTTSATSSRTLPTITTVTTSPTDAPTDFIYESLRLPNIYETTNYNLKIKFGSPDLKINDTFEGTIEMNFNLKAPTKEILFHADSQLKILDPIKILNVDTNEQVTITNEIHKPVINEYYYINLNSRTLNPGRYRISMGFKSLHQSLYEKRGAFALRYLDNLVEK